jgi:single-strand DNA-binding protein
MIQASIHGRIGGEPVTSETKTGKPMCRLSVAVDVAGHGTTDPETIWIGVMAFNRVADTLARASKGEMMTAMGKLTKSRYVARDGTERESWSLLADAVLVAKSARPSGRKASPRAGGYDAGAPFDDSLDF